MAIQLSWGENRACLLLEISLGATIGWPEFRLPACWTQLNDKVGKTGVQVLYYKEKRLH
jgi:hypothetical protein